MLNRNALHRSDLLSGKAKVATYVNTALNHYSTIDYMLASSKSRLIEFMVIDPDINYSDHLPIMARYACNAVVKADGSSKAYRNARIMQLRWDHADLVSYYHFTGLGLQPVLTELNNVITQLGNPEMGWIFQSHNPRITIESNKLRKAARKPRRRRPIFDKRQTCRLCYCKCTRDGQQTLAAATAMI